MNNKIFKIIIIGVVTLSTLVSASSVSDESIIGRAAKQRMLSQTMAKNYFYVAERVNRIVAKKALKRNIDNFNKTQNRLIKGINNQATKDLIAFVDMSMEEFEEMTAEEYNIDNGIIILDLSESILEGSNYIVQALLKDKKVDTILDVAGRQRMLSQRIAKYYIAYQAGIKDNNTIVQMQEAVKEFNENLILLINNKNNTPKINRLVRRVQRMWKMVYRLYLNIEGGGLPRIVYSTTNRITKKMNKIVSLYQRSMIK